MTTPDLITLFQAETGAPVTADALRYGLRGGEAVAWHCDPQWRTPAGIALVGSRYFGYATEDRPPPTVERPTGLSTGESPGCKGNA